jgi:uncharacterized protein
MRLREQVQRLLAAQPAPHTAALAVEEAARRARLAQLRRELERIDRRYHSSFAPPPPLSPALSRPPAPSLPDPVDDDGLLYRHIYPPTHRFGEVSVAPFAAPLLGRVEELLTMEAGTPAPPGELRAEQLLFLDIETTGLSRAAGTLAFLIGLGRFVDGALEVEQLLLRDPAQESLVLQHLQRRLEDARVLCTFNGRGFDVPVLRNRGVLCRLPLTLDRPHLDLLPPSRRLFRPRLLDCRLGTIERHILRFTREGDVDGAEVPRIYTDYLRTGSLDELCRVMEHNRLDVAVLAALLVCICDHLLDPLRWAEDAEELLSTGKTLLRRGRVELGRACLERGLELAHRPATRRRLLAALAGHLRRSGGVEESVGLWERYRDEFPDDDVGWIELAKYHEHVSKDLGRALALAEGVPRVGSDEHQRRLERLRRRLARVTCGRQRTRD